MQSDEQRVLVWDIETTNLKADLGWCMSVAWKFLDERRVYSDSLLHYEDPKRTAHPDRWMLDKFGEVLSSASVWVTHYGTRFDAPYIQTRLMMQGDTVLPRPRHVDTLFIARPHLALAGNSLKNITTVFDLPRKTPLDKAIWVRAMRDHKPSLRYVVDHNEADVIGTEAAYLKLRPLLMSHPHMGLLKGVIGAACHVCGENKLQRRGFQVNRTKVQQRVQCTGCGAWSVR